MKVYHIIDIVLLTGEHDNSILVDFRLVDQCYRMDTINLTALFREKHGLSCIKVKETPEEILEKILIKEDTNES